ncbi:SDR family oxidoreductase [Micromonospora sp. DR5-3]|uniref:SDR family oxidoreductase n=1 Tax=unclassified Micromonospora TaxID=2617518 RepID=UPI0011DBC69D|nr:MULTISPECIES: SDR family oxidoreductase [unclassified Micromonospora]MCW3815550.1 SDR family oxidoreductase [Micromonospora sp. DR5-3]TYC19824.1 SDR family oxidoreductase [Micromonospora sp. MP36]
MTTTIALVTGANKGIGLATARQFGARGWTVLVGARDAARGREAERALRAEGADARFVPLDVTDEASVAAAAELVEREYGHLDVLVNNAGIIRADGSALPSETTLATLREVYETNVFGVVAVTNAFLPLLHKAPAARIVNVSSEVGSIGVMTDPQGALFELTSVPYPSSKAALNMITAMYAKELRDTPIKVNAANPGYCATDLNHHSGFRTPEQGAEVSVQLATLPADGPSGLLWGFQMDAGGGYGVLPW